MAKKKDPTIQDQKAWKELVKSFGTPQDDGLPLEDFNEWDLYKEQEIETVSLPDDLIESEIKAPPKVKKEKDFKPEIDLHHMTQDQAYKALKVFLQKAHQKKCKKVLVITGKGKQSDDSFWEYEGVLKNIVPRWLKESPFDKIVQKSETAKQKDGGAGALWVHLKK